MKGSIPLTLILLLASTSFAISDKAIVHAKRTTIKQVQSMLTELGYEPGIQDGIIDHKMRLAIELFQKHNGLKTNRFLDDATWKKLREVYQSMVEHRRWIYDNPPKEEK